MQRRKLLRTLALSSAAANLPWLTANSFATPPQGMPASGGVSVEDLPPLEGKLTLYLGRGEGGLYEKILDAIKKRNPKFELSIRRGPSAALANAIMAEAKAGVHKADVFWAVDTGSIGMVKGAKLAHTLPADLIGQLQPTFQYPDWLPITGRIRTLPYNTQHFSAEQVPNSIMSLAQNPAKIGWAPAYEAFQSFVTAMRLLEGDQATAAWLKDVRKHAKKFAGELGVVMAVERGEVDFGFANHYYTLRLKSGKPNANVALAFTNNDAGCLVNASGIVALRPGPKPINFMRYLLTKEVQSFLANEAFEIPLINGVAPPKGLVDLSSITPPKLDLTRLADMRPTLELMRKVGVL